jgi:formylglycine-generating enzyme required for sulfatase activity
VPRAGPEFDFFLSYNRLDRAAVEPLAQSLRDRDLRVFKDDWYLRPGEYWPAALEKKLATSGAILVAIGRNGLGPWQQREAVAALNRQDRQAKVGKPVPPVIPVLLEQGSERQAGLVFLLQNTWVEAWDPRAPDLIAGALRGKAPAESYDQYHPDPRTLICPYRGLGVFREEDAAFYFGREPDLERLIAAVDRYPLVAVVGASGSGKSSLARAGLFPRLRQRTRDRVWQVVDMVPGRDPFLALARSLLPLREPERILTWSKGDIDDECDRLRARLERDGAGYLSHVVAQILEEEPGTTQLLLLVDQWEELYTYRPTGAAAQVHAEQVRRFIRMLLEALDGGTLQAVLTLRADYWGKVLNDQPLAACLPYDAQVHLTALDHPALEAVIRKPAELTGLMVPDALTEVLLAAAIGQPGDLPLLEFALQQLWLERERTGSSAVSLDAYRAMGGLEKAIISRAENVYTRLKPKEQEAVPGVFAALVQVGEARTDLRRRARLAELSEAGQAVARRLADERLLVTSRDWTTGDDLVEVAHEALLRHWPKLGAWIEARRDALLTIRQLQADTRNWLEKGKNPSYLWSHERVREAVAALGQLGPEVVLNDDERAFLGPIDPDAMLAELERPDTDHRRRALIGERLDVLGDPRRGVGVNGKGTPQIAWCPVERGEVALEGVDLPPKRVESFHIARYPITVAQYRAFLQADDGWRSLDWWSDDLDRDSAGNGYNFGRFGNHPAVYVNWFDAMAFCRWLSWRLRFTVRLPNEWEWQQAATGGDISNNFPWGFDWDPNRDLQRANTSESLLAGTTAVGMYPAGASPKAAFDMGGTVWEWCLNLHDEPDLSISLADDSHERALRGGSWFNKAGFARCAFRGKLSPASRGYRMGFRVACSSHQESLISGRRRESDTLRLQRRTRGCA